MQPPPQLAVQPPDGDEFDVPPPTWTVPAESVAVFGPPLSLVWIGTVVDPTGVCVEPEFCKEPT